MANEFDLEFKTWPKAVNYIINNLSGMVGGSVVVNEDDANDIDVVVNHYAYMYHRDAQVQLAMMGFVSLREGDKKYDDIDHERLVDVLELPATDDAKKINLLVVGAVYWPAYIAAITCMTIEPERYQTRDERIALHKDFCAKVKELSEGHI